MDTLPLWAHEKLNFEHWDISSRPGLGGEYPHCNDPSFPGLDLTKVLFVLVEITLSRGFEVGCRNHNDLVEIPVGSTISAACIFFLAIL